MWKNRMLTADVNENHSDFKHQLLSDYQQLAVANLIFKWSFLVMSVIFGHFFVIFCQSGLIKVTVNNKQLYCYCPFSKQAKDIT